MTPLTGIAQRMVILDSGRILADDSIREVLVKESILEKSRLRPPELAQLFSALYKKKEQHKQKLPLNIKEAMKELEKLF